MEQDSSRFIVWWILFPLCSTTPFQLVERALVSSAACNPIMGAPPWWHNLNLIISQGTSNIFRPAITDIRSVAHTYFNKMLILPFLSVNQHSLILFFFFGLFAFSRAAPRAYGGSQARGPIGAVAAVLRHSNTGSKPRLQPTPQLRFVNNWATIGTPTLLKGNWNVYSLIHFSAYYVVFSG